MRRDFPRETSAAQRRESAQEIEPARRTGCLEAE
jgi:hypothetical protein